MCKRTPKQMVIEVRTTMALISSFFDEKSVNEDADAAEHEALRARLNKQLIALEGMIKDTFGLDSYALRLLIDDAESDLQ